MHVIFQDHCLLQCILLWKEGHNCKRIGQNFMLPGDELQIQAPTDDLAIYSWSNPPNVKHPFQKPL